MENPNPDLVGSLLVLVLVSIPVDKMGEVCYPYLSSLQHNEMLTFIFLIFCMGSYCSVRESILYGLGMNGGVTMSKP